nr:reverse transcriptase domain-containing protein, chloroplastic [Tanacetum cinerariifolium]
MLRACPHYGFTKLAQIETFYNGLNDNDQDSLNAAAGGNLLSKTTREALQISENKSKVRYSRNKPNVSRMNTTSRENINKLYDRIDKLADQISTLVDIFAKKIVTPAPVKVVEEYFFTCGGNHAYYNCPNTDSNQPSFCVATGTYNQVAPQNRASNYMAPPGFAPIQNGQNRFNQNPGQGNNFNRGNNFQPFQVPNPGFQNQHFQVPNNPFQQGEFKNEIQNTMKTRQTVLMEQQNAFQNNLQNMLSGFIQNQSSTLGTLPSNTIPNPKGEMKAITTRSGVAYDGPSIPTRKKVVEHETEETTNKEQSNFQGSNTHIQPPAILIPELDATNQMDKFFQIFQDLHFDISFADALLLMPKFASMIKSLLTNKDKLFELAKIPLNENCSAMLLKKLPEKLGDPGKFLIPCDFPRMDVCHALADLDASINLMPLSIWKKLSLPKLTPTRMTLELEDRSITRPKGVTKAIFIKVGKFHFLTDFIVLDFEADPRVPLILGRSLLRIGRALIDIYGEEITLRVNDEAVTFNLNQTTRYSSSYDDLSSKSSIEEPPEVELKDLPSHLEYDYLEENDKLPVINSKDLKVDEKEALLNALKSHKRAIAWKITDIKGIDPRFCTHKILMEEDFKPSIQSQRSVNPKIHEVIKKEVLKLLDAGMIYPIFDSPWDSPIHCVPKKRGIVVVANEENELIPTCLVTGWRVCIDYRKLNEATRKDHFQLPFMDQMLERLAGNEFYCFLDGFSSYFQIPIDPQDQEKTTFTCPYGTFAYLRMPFGLCNAPGTFQRWNFIVKGMSSQQKKKFFKDTSGQVEVSNHGLKRILESMVGKNRASWSDKLDDALWAPRTAFKTPIGCTLFKLTAGDHRKLQLNELNELRDQAYKNSLIYKERTKNLHDSKIKNHIFNVGDRVLLFNSHLKLFSGKLKTRSSGPFTITNFFSYGTVELSQPDGPNIKERILQESREKSQKPGNNGYKNGKTEAMKEGNLKEENLCDMNKEFKTRTDGTLCIEKQSWVPRFVGLRKLIMNESHKSKYLIYLGLEKMYHDLKKMCC